MAEINQKEYLKKYLSIGTEPGMKKKKKKKVKNVGNRVKIIDDDADVVNNFTIPEEEVFASGEDAPQIVGVIDDRPLALKIDDYRKSDLWKPLGSTDELRSVIKEKNMNHGGTNFKLKTLKKDQIENDNSPPRKQRSITNRRLDIKTNRVNSESSFKAKDRSPSKLNTHDDLIPPRKGKERDISPPRRRRSLDISPPRKIKVEDFSPPRRRNDDDISPPRKKDEDMSPPRKRRNYDVSPPRRKPGESSKRSNERHSTRRLESTDVSPQRKRKYDNSPTRQNRKHSEQFDLSKRNKSDSYKKELNESEQTKKMSKTLDGKTAGLQKANELIKETQEFKKRENELFENMPAELSGINAVPVMRNRKTGKVRDLEQEAEIQHEKQKKEKEIVEKYSKWGKGLKQVEDQNEKLAQDLYEMTKPLARYADDEDLEKFLKEQEREGDPMLNYIRKKKKKDAVAAGKSLKPTYMGEFMPNRFGIPPGHRWDGVDRSNGYEKKWFQVQNAKKAEQEEIYKWNTEDM